MIRCECGERATRPKWRLCSRCYHRKWELGELDTDTQEKREFEPTTAYRDLLSPETRARLEAFCARTLKR